jgi:hypothetical protein
MAAYQSTPKMATKLCAILHQSGTATNWLPFFGEPAAGSILRRGGIYG